MQAGIQKLKTLALNAGDVLQIGDSTEIRVIRRRDGSLRCEIWGLDGTPVCVAKCRQRPLNCRRTRKT